MSTIYTPDNNFSFDNLTLAKPILTTGGNYFIRCIINNAPLYIQPPKCKTKQGILNTGKKIYTDLMFSNMNCEFIQWIETLENTCQQYIYNNRETWFDGDMELHEIENYFTSTLKTYKSGKFYLIRTGIPSSLGNPIIKIYDENELLVNMNTIDDNTDIMNILEIKGIKCSAKSFQIEIEIKQILVMKPDNLFDSFLLKGTNQQSKTEQNPITVEEPIVIDTAEEPIVIDTAEELVVVETVEEPVIKTVEQSVTESINDNNSTKMIENINVIPSEPDSIQENNKNYLEQNNTLEEVQLNLEEITDTVQIKERNDLYYQLYREARKKAKISRDLAISSFLEAKRIKNTYMLQDNSDSEESDLENEEFIQ